MRAPLCKGLCLDHDFEWSILRVSCRREESGSATGHSPPACPLDLRGLLRALPLEVTQVEVEDSLETLLLTFLNSPAMLTQSIFLGPVSIFNTFELRLVYGTSSEDSLERRLETFSKVR